MVPVGYRPILWHVMQYYAITGITTSCCASATRPTSSRTSSSTTPADLSNDFVHRPTAGKGRAAGRATCHDWRITLVDTGLTRNIGQRLLAVASTSRTRTCSSPTTPDGLTDAPLPEMVDHSWSASGKVGRFLCRAPDATPSTWSSSTRTATSSASRVSADRYLDQRRLLRLHATEIFDYIREGEELVVEPFQRLIDEGQLLAYRHDGFWRAMDTLKDKQILEDMVERGDCPGSRRSGRRWRRPMKGLQLARARPAPVRAGLGAHSDDIEIGAGATLLSQVSGARSRRTVVRAFRAGPREAEARDARPSSSPAPSAPAWMPTSSATVLSRQLADVKGWFEQLKGRSSPT